MDWFLYDRDLRHERVNIKANANIFVALLTDTIQQKHSIRSFLKKATDLNECFRKNFYVEYL